MNRILTLPGVYRPRDDSFQLADVIAGSCDLPEGSRVLDLCTGTGVIALGLAAAGHDVTAVDLSRRAAMNVRINAWLAGVNVDARRGDLFGAVASEEFDLIVANPPYVPAPPGERHAGAARAWNAGADGRLIIDRICGGVGDHLRPGGSAMVLQSSLANVDATLERLGEAGLEPRVAASEYVPLGPIAASRADYLQEHGFSENGGEWMTVIRADKPRGPRGPRGDESPPEATAATATR